MAPLRILVLGLLCAAAATPAFAQNTQLELDNLRAQQQAAQQRAIAQANESMALEARLRAEQAVADLRLQRTPPVLPELPYVTPASDAARAAAATATYPSIPDAALADSNRKVQDAAQTRR
ncbi:hypothetical protein [Phenylobacterium sp.]|uniref:hypothetical protein n=1 Tax=Phenylobacterium sp. TaxID=1871053 RepID=UPI0025F17567|nr:hypothetical protein [Phenylobacterium sp.]